MRLVQFLSLAMGVASMAVNPLGRLDIRHPSTLIPEASADSSSTNSKPVESFSISDLYSESFADTGTTWNCSLSFVFSDPNSNTSTICSKSWIDSGDTSSAPTTYQPCDNTGNDERFQWQFLSYTSTQRFSIGFSHGWNDPANYPPPYSWISMSSTENDFDMTCANNTQGLQHCDAPQNPYRAAVNGLSN